MGEALTHGTHGIRRLIERLAFAGVVETDSLDLFSGPLIDVRQASEYAAGHLPGAHSVELGLLPRAADGIPNGAVVMCGHGDRAMTAASVIERAGGQVGVLLGGPERWTRSPGQALERGLVTAAAEVRR